MHNQGPILPMKVSNPINCRAQSECIHLVFPTDKNYIYIYIYAFSNNILPQLPPRIWYDPHPWRVVPHNWLTVSPKKITDGNILKAEIFYSIKSLVFLLSSHRCFTFLCCSVGSFQCISKLLCSPGKVASKRPTLNSNPVSTWQCVGPNTRAKSYQLPFNLVFLITAY